MVDFICTGLLDLFGTRTRNYIIKNSYPQLDSNPGPSANVANALSFEQLELINIDHQTVTAFYLSVLCKSPVLRFHLVLPVLFLEILSCIFLILYFYCFRFYLF